MHSSLLHYSKQNKVRMKAEQGDQIGRIFAHWVYFGQFLENYRPIPHYWATLWAIFS
jgi:hypothetical protein